MTRMGEVRPAAAQMVMNVKLMDHAPPSKKYLHTCAMDYTPKSATILKLVVKPSMRPLVNTYAALMTLPALISMTRMEEAKLAAAQMVMNARLMDHVLQNFFKTLKCLQNTTKPLPYLFKPF